MLKAVLLMMLDSGRKVTLRHLKMTFSKSVYTAFSG